MWKPILDFPNYQVSDEGKVKNIKTGFYIYGSPSSYKTKDIILHLYDGNNKKTDRRLDLTVASHFIENPNHYKCVDHINGDKKDNSSKNLMWVYKRKAENNLCSDLDNEIWKVIFCNYEVSNYGNVRNFHTKRLIKKTKNLEKYVIVTLTNDNKRGQYRVHRLVAICFIPNPDNKLSVDHIDCQKDNNCVSNLRWATAKEQCQNRVQSKKRDIYETTRKIFMTDLTTNETYLHSNIDSAIKYIIENKLSEAKYSCIKQHLTKQVYKLKSSGINEPCYGFKWGFEEPPDLAGELWKKLRTIKPEALDMSISNFGRIKNEKGHLVEGTVKVYVNVYVGKKCKRLKLHRLVAELFIPNPQNKKFVNHKDGNKLNNTEQNLEWSTEKENSQHAVNTGLMINSKRIEVLNNVTQKISSFNNIKDASEKLNIKPHILYKRINNNKMHNNLTFKKIENIPVKQQNNLLKEQRSDKIKEIVIITVMPCSIKCECGSIIKKTSLNSHKKSQKHTKNMLNLKT